MHLTPIDSKLLFSRGDLNDVRLGERVSLLPKTEIQNLTGELSTRRQASPQDDHVLIAGYADDAGILVNGGRPGARLAPEAIRRPLYKMTPSLLEPRPQLKIWDAGDLPSSPGEDIGVRHETAYGVAAAAYQSGMRYISFGGGHDYGFPDARAFIESCRAQGVRPLVINFDAHLDVRPTTSGLSSGTPYYRMYEFEKNIDFVEIGIQNQCNSLTHLRWLKEHGGLVIFLDEIVSAPSLASLLTTRLQDWLVRPRPALISVDIDALSSSLAPGCSQSWATGLTAREFFSGFDLLLQRLDVRGLGIYEVSPPLDQDDRTSKLAAQIAHRYLFHSSTPEKKKGRK